MTLRIIIATRIPTQPPVPSVPLSRILSSLSHDPSKPIAQANRMIWNGSSSQDTSALGNLHSLVRP